MSQNELSVVASELSESELVPDFLMAELQTDEEKRLLKHKAWLRTINREIPSPKRHFKVGIYIRYFNQTKYENYLELHKKQYEDTISLCPNWTLVDFYVDEGAKAPNMENAPEWSRLLEDCYDGKVDLIITQKVSNVTSKYYEISFVARILAAHNPPIGIYFVSENIFTLATYYLLDLHDPEYLPSPDWKLLPDEEDDVGLPDEIDKDWFE